MFIKLINSQSLIHISIALSFRDPWLDSDEENLDKLERSRVISGEHRQLSTVVFR